MNESLNKLREDISKLTQLWEAIGVQKPDPWYKVMGNLYSAMRWLGVHLTDIPLALICGFIHGVVASFNFWKEDLDN